MKFFPGDEVCMIRKGHLAFGTLLQKTSKSGGSDELWKVDWNDGEGKSDAESSELTLTDRPISIGCKVKRVDTGAIDDSLEGICRNVSLFADLRFVGTNTMLNSVSISGFTHLKELQQKSVVYLNGWLGTIAESERFATVVLSNNDLDDQVPLSNFNNHDAQMIEVPWINERLTIPLRKYQSRQPNPNLNIIPPNNNFRVPIDPNKIHSEPKFLHDLSVVNVKVKWHYQVDPMCPDPPPRVLKGSRLSQLSLVMEQSGTDVPFQMGNLGRFFLRAVDELIGFKDYERSFIKKNLPATQLELLSNEEPYAERAYLIRPEEVIEPEKTRVVEIFHLSGTVDVMWQDGTMEFARSVDLINVIDERLLISVLNVMDFVYSRKIQSPMERTYAVVQRTDLKEKTVLVKVLTTDNPPKVIQENLLLADSEVFPHPRYRYFNETNSIVVMHQEQNHRIGHVRRSNFSGKIQVCWIDTKREEWCWPTECSLYIVRGFDIECIISQTNDADEVSSCPARRFQKVLEKLSQVKEIWESIDKWEDRRLAESIENLKYALDACLNAEKMAGLVKETYISIEKFSGTTSALATLSLADGEVNYREQSFVKSMQEYCTYLHGAALLLFQYITQVQAEMVSETMDVTELSRSSPPTRPSPSQPVPMEVDEVEDFQTNNNNNTGMGYSKIFNQPVQMMDSVPTSHSYAKEPFEQGQYQALLKIIKNEMSNFHESRVPGIKVVSYQDRLDLFSIAICGPEKTPYEDTLCLFDAKLPASYPAVPPKVNFLPYGAGRLNPNLYDCGKVCLSLLGTWRGKEGESWTKDSNLLQVLISIQGLILVSEPYHNEPGFEADNYTEGVRNEHRRDYNNMLMPKICQMMLTQVQKPGNDDIRPFYKESLPRFIARWRKLLQIANAHPKFTKEQFLLSLSKDERPGFEIYPFHPTLVTSMTACLNNLEKAYQKHCTTDESIEPSGDA